MSSREPLSTANRWLGPGELARQAQTTIKALRVYEKAGLLTPDRRGGGWRVYGPEHIVRLHYILALKALGLSLKQIGETLGRDSLAIGQILDLQARKLASDIRSAQGRLRRVQQAREHLAEHGMVPADLLLELARNLAPPLPLDLMTLRGVIENAAREEGVESTVRAALCKRTAEEDEVTEGQVGALMAEAAILAAAVDPGSPSAALLADRWLALAATLDVPSDDTQEAAALRRVAVRITADPQLADTFTFLRAAVKRRTASPTKG